VDTAEPGRVLKTLDNLEALTYSLLNDDSDVELDDDLRDR
jgi:hypothetical protein